MQAKTCACKCINIEINKLRNTEFNQEHVVFKFKDENLFVQNNSLYYYTSLSVFHEF